MKAKKMFSFLLAVIMMLGVLLVPSVDAEAAATSSVPSFYTTKKVQAYSKDVTWILSLENLGNGKVSSWKSSNTKVIKLASTNYGKGKKGYRTVGSGTAVISCKVKKGGRTYTPKIKITVRKVDGFQYIKVDGKNVYRGKNYIFSNVKRNGRKSVKVSWKLKPGYKLVDAVYFSEKTGKTVKVKNGKKVTLKSGFGYVMITYKNSKNEYFAYDVDIE